MNKGFTLMELLAVIVLLALLSGVVLFSLGSIINSSKTNLTNNQITLIEKAAQVYYLEEGINSEKYSFNNTKSCISLEYLIKNGYVDDDKVINIAKNKEFNGSVEVTYKANQYQYKYKDTKCPVSACKIIKGDGTNIGDEIECAGEYFYVIESNEDTISMLAKYNLNVGDNAYSEGKLDVQNEQSIGYKEGFTTYGAVEFSNSMYWTGADYKPAGDSSYNYIFDSNTNLYTHVQNYKMYLKNKGVTSVDAKLISYEQLISLGCDYSNSTCTTSKYDWVYSTTYWSGSASYSAYIWSIWSDGRFRNEVAYVAPSLGIRPVITISVNEL